MNIDKKKKNLENTGDVDTNVDDSFLDDVQETGADIDNDEETDDSFFDDLDFDDEDEEDDLETPVEDDDEEEDTDDESDTEDEDTDEDELEEEDEQPEVQPKKKKLSPSEIKVINLKKENQRLLKEKRELEQKTEQKKREQETEKVKQKYIDDGYDDDTAKIYAQNEVRLKEIEERQATLDFREDNVDLFNKYPQAKKDVSTIMRNSKLTGMSPEQICIGMYGASTNEYDDANVRAVSGLATRQTNKNDASTRAARATSANNSVTLTSKELRMKKYLEETFNGGEKISVEQFKKYTNS